MSEAAKPTTIPKWVFPALLSVGILVVAIALGTYAEAPQIPGTGRGRMFPRVSGPPESLPILLFMLGVGSVTWYAIALAIPLLLLGARRIDSDRHGIGRVIAISTAAVAGGIVATVAADYLITFAGAPSKPGFGAYFPDGIRRSAVPWIAVVAIIAAIEARRRAVQSRLERERLRAQIAEQRLVALTGQLHPHFLFNTLQGISTLIHRDANAADEMLGKLSDLLREVLRHRDQALVSLGDEVRYARTYLDIARLRFADRLEFAIDVPAELHGAAVPLFILQPLIENALGHGIGTRALGGNVSVRARRDGNRLKLEVEDDGGGLPVTAVKDGIGLSNTRERLRASFENDHSFALEPSTGGGVLARIDIPYRAVGTR